MGRCKDCGCVVVILAWGDRCTRYVRLLYIHACTRMTRTFCLRSLKIFSSLSQRIKESAAAMWSFADIVCIAIFGISRYFLIYNVHSSSKSVLVLVIIAQ